MKKEEFLRQVKENRKLDTIDDYEIYISDDVNLDSKIKIKHLLCGNIFEMRASNFKNFGYRCPICYGNRNKHNIESVKKDIEQDGNYELLSNTYTNGKTKLKIKHKICGDIFYMTYFDWQRNHRCPKCAKNKKLTAQEMAENIHKIDPDYECCDYSAKNAHSKIKILHKSCGHYFEMQYNNFKFGQRCPICAIKNASGNYSKAVKKIISWLEKNNILFELEKSFDDLKMNKKKLRFDFYLPNLNLILEYNGAQHYHYNKHGFFTKEKHDKIVLYDKIKKQYAISHNFNYEVIPYTKSKNIEECLKKIINKYK